MSAVIYRVVDKNGEPVNYRNNERKNFYTSRANAQSAATQFNNTEVWDSVNVRAKGLEGAPYSVEAGSVTWGDLS